MSTIRAAAMTIAACLAFLGATPRPHAVVTFGKVAIGDGIVLHYAEAGRGIPVVFVHGSLSDYGYWKDEVEDLTDRYHAIAYSRRYNYPNVNPARAGYSAVTDADDFAAFVKARHLGRVVLVGHSYGALMALFAAVRHPETIAALVLAEPPAISLLADLPGAEEPAGRAMLADIDARMVAPMRAAFAKGDRETGVAAFIDYVFNDPHAWKEMPASSRDATMRDAHEWDVMMTTGTLFPAIRPSAIRKVGVPVLLLSGDKTYPFLTAIDDELARLLPNSQTLIVHGAGHQMWYQQTSLCEAALVTFVRWAVPNLGRRAGRPATSQ